MFKTTVIGIDPGQNGAIVVWADSGAIGARRFPWLDGMGADPGELVNILRPWCGHPCVVVLEVSRAFAGAGRTMGAVSAQTTGRTQGIVEGVCAGLDLQLEMVDAQTWQTILEPSTLDLGPRVKTGGTPAEGDLAAKERARRIALKRADVKARSIASVKRRLPNLGLLWARCRKESDGIADAANMCLWWRARQEGVVTMLPASVPGQTKK